MPTSPGARGLDAGAAADVAAEEGAEWSVDEGAPKISDAGVATGRDTDTAEAASLMMLKHLDAPLRQRPAGGSAEVPPATASPTVRDIARKRAPNKLIWDELTILEPPSEGGGGHWVAQGGGSNAGVEGGGVESGQARVYPDDIIFENMLGVSLSDLISFSPVV